MQGNKNDLVNRSMDALSDLPHPSYYEGAFDKLQIDFTHYKMLFDLLLELAYRCKELEDRLKFH